MNQSAARFRTFWYGLFAMEAAVLALAGYVVWLLYPRYSVPSAEGAALLLLSAGSGIALFFSPCAFPLLITLLARRTSLEAKPERSGIAEPLLFASAVSLGVSVFLLLSGVIIALGGRTLFAGVTFTSMAGMVIRTSVGCLLIVLGLVQLGVVSSLFPAVDRVAYALLRFQAGQRRRRPVTGFAAFGFSYPLAGFG